MAERGRMLTIAISAYLAVKAVLNLILSFDSTNVVTLILTVALVFLMIAPSNTIAGIKGFFTYSNYVTSFYLAMNVIAHISYNLSNLPGTWLYLLEAVLDIAVIFLLCVQKDVREFFKTK